VGTIGRYEIVETLAHGETGEIHRAVLKGPFGFAREVALLRVSASPAEAQELARQISSAPVSFAHQSLIIPFELGEHEGTWFVVSDYVPGHSVRKILAQSGKPPASAALRIVMETALGLAHLHTRGTYLGGVEPRAILVTGTGDVRIRDAGVPLLSSHGHPPESRSASGDVLSSASARSQRSSSARTVPRGSDR
jgi:serine/threonine protein kinase